MKTNNAALSIPRADDIKNEAIQIIIEKLGITKAAFFLRETISQKADYLNIKDELFGKKNAEELYNEIKKSTR